MSDQQNASREPRSAVTLVVLVGGLVLACTDSLPGGLSGGQGFAFGALGTLSALTLWGVAPDVLRRIRR